MAARALAATREWAVKEKREQAPALQTELSTAISIAEDRGKSRKTLRSGRMDRHG